MEPFKNAGKPGAPYIFFILLVMALIVADQAIKFFVFTLAHARLYGGVVGLEPFLNNKFAFSLPVPVVIMYVVYAAVMAAIIIYLQKNWQKLGQFHKIAWALILAGAISNIGERIALGYVRDFIYILNGIFNIADAYIILGILALFKKEFKN